MQELAPVGSMKSGLSWRESARYGSRDPGDYHPAYFRSPRPVGQVPTWQAPGITSFFPKPQITERMPRASTEIGRFGKNHEYALRVAVSEADRLKCWHLAYKEYLALGYTDEKELEYRYSLHDALPDMATFLVEHRGEAVGTVSVFPDSPLGLPADDIYKSEIDRLRWQGRQVVEVGRLTIAREHMNERSVLISMLDVVSVYLRRIRKVTDMVITVNPSHAKYYERGFLLQRIGEARHLGSVGNAPAVLLRLDLELSRKIIRWTHGEGATLDVRAERTFYKHFSNKAEEERKVARLRACLSIPDEAFLKRYFVWLRPLLPQLSAPLKDFFDNCYPHYDLATA